MTAQSATTQEANFHLVRDRINRGALAAYVDAVEPENVRRGQGLAFEKTWYGPQGFKAWEFHDGESRRDWAWVTAMNKTANQTTSGATPDPATEYGILIQEHAQPIWGMQRRFYLPQRAWCVFHAHADINTPAINQFGVPYRLANYSGATPSEAYLWVDGVKVTASKGYSFEERFGAAPSGERTTGLTTASNYPSEYWTRRYYHMTYAVFLYDGWHTMEFTVDPRMERSYAARRGYTIDCWYQ